MPTKVCNCHETRPCYQNGWDYARGMYPNLEGLAGYLCPTEAMAIQDYYRGREAGERLTPKVVAPERFFLVANDGPRGIELLSKALPLWEQAEKLALSLCGPHTPVYILTATHEVSIPGHPVPPATVTETVEAMDPLDPSRGWRREVHHRDSPEGA